MKYFVFLLIWVSSISLTHAQTDCDNVVVSLAGNGESHFVKESGWLAPPIHKFELKAQHVTDLKRQEVNTTLLKPKKLLLYEFPGFRSSNQNCSAVKSVNYQIAAMRSYALDDRVFTVGFLLISVSNVVGVKGYTGPAFWVWLYDSDGDGDFETLFRSKALEEPESLVVP